MENKCDNCSQPLSETKQIKVQSTDGAIYACSECASEFAEPKDAVRG